MGRSLSLSTDAGGPRSERLTYAPPENEPTLSTQGATGGTARITPELSIHISEGLVGECSERQDQGERVCSS